LAVTAGLVLLHLSHPLTWGRPVPDLWFPAAGLGLAFVAWFGPRAALLMALDGLLVALQAYLAGVQPAAGAEWSPSLMAAADALLGPAEILLGWWIYHHLAGGARSLGDPRSATLFLVIVPGVTAGLFALLRVALALAFAALAQAVAPLPGPLFAEFWLSWALGLLVVGPPLLVAVTPWLVRRELAVAEAERATHYNRHGLIGADRLTVGDWVEIAGLAFGSAILGVVFALVHGTRDLAGWQLWGAPLLLIVWASLRQGLRGGTIVAAAATSLPLVFLSGARAADAFLPVLQGNLLAQCAAGLLVAASASWIRGSEKRYRQVVGHVPVVIYSARIQEGETRLEEPGSRPEKDRGKAEDDTLPVDPLPTVESPSPTFDARLASSHRPPAAEITFVSAAGAVILGCPPERLLGDYRRWLRLVHPDDREVVLAALSQLARQDRPVTCEYRLTPKDPADPLAFPPVPTLQAAAPPTRWVRDTLAPNFDPDGRLIGWEGVVTDITEQRVLADDLRRTTNMIHALVANLPTGVFFVQGPHGAPILVNARARQLLGQREDPSAGLEQLAQTYRLFRPDGTPYPVQGLPVYQALRLGTRTMRDDVVVHRPDGRRVPLVTWAAPVDLGGKGKPDAAVWVLEDLTALHQAEAARRDTEGRLRAVVETMGEGLIVQDRKGMIVEANPAACALLRLPLEKLRGRVPGELDWTFLREDGTPLHWEEMPGHTVLRSGKPVRNVVIGLQKKEDGDKAITISSSSVRWLLANAMPLGTTGAPAGVVITFFDVTAYRQAQEGVRLSEERYRGLVESLPLMLLQADRNQRVVYANPATTRITGYEVAEIAEPRGWASVLHPEDLPRVIQLGKDALAGRAGRVEARYHAKDGSEKVGYVLVHPRWEGEEIIGTTTLIVDVTRERQLEQELQRSQRLELIGRLSSGIAHDFNNLLSVILTLTDLVRRNLAEDHPAHADLARITEVSEQAASMASQLLAFSKKRRLATGRVDVGKVVRRTLELLAPTLPSQIQVETALADGPLPVQADETQLQQVLMNLCLNARDAMPQGGKLWVQAEAAMDCPDQSPNQKGWVRLSVCDDGEGMSDEVRTRIFDPFFSTKERGTGLGLAVVQQIVESYGGRVEVTSRLGQGARFDVWFPCDAGA
jgi:PAS domain S-box-containing protein